MDSKKFLIGTLVGGITFFILGYLIYGKLLMNFFMQHSIAPSGSMKTMDELVWWALILGNLATGAFLTYIFLKIGNVNSFGSGASIAAAIGFFVGLSDGLVRFATENTSDMTGVFTNVLVGIVMMAITGGIVAAAIGMGKKKS
jgi:hypothetical protein